ncbi:hypothetical protein [Alicyclobacillus sp. SO9]|uniref:hypothetical protein n=1 Tax=Alicyclobacillus sp. SO9 TaxID=2665646 RepID=UPI0018E846D7|nr:hypothetical protein [Alicyclobacillus sp. SO9]QQE79554.1 hypothetical protein GI364_03395 [Alicyclobacillus sp. SO9]
MKRYLQRIWQEEAGNSLVGDMAFAPYAVSIFLMAVFVTVIICYVVWANFVFAVAVWDGAQAESRSPGIGSTIVMQTVKDAGISTAPSVSVNDHDGDQVDVSATLQLPIPDLGVFSQYGFHPSLTLTKAYLAPRWWT